MYRVDGRHLQWPPGKNLPGNFPEFSRKFPGISPEISRNFPGNSPKISRNFPGILGGPRIPSQELGNIFEHSPMGNHSRKFPGNSPEISGNRCHSRRKSFPEISRKFPGNSPEISRKFPFRRCLRWTRGPRGRPRARTATAAANGVLPHGSTGNHVFPCAGPGQPARPAQRRRGATPPGKGAEFVRGE